MHAAQKAAGITGYSGTRNGGASALLARNTKSVVAVSRKKVQNTGEVDATIAVNPSGVIELATTRTRANAPCTMSAFAGVLPDSRQFPSSRKAPNSRPSE